MTDNIFLRCISSAKAYIFPLLSLKSSRTIISTDSLHFCSQKIAQQVSKQTNQYFSVSDGQKNLSTLTPILSNVFARLSISVLDRHFTCQCFEKTERAAIFYKKNKKKQDFKVFPGFRHNLNFANYFFKIQILKILCRNSTISHLIINVDPKY